MKSKVIKNPQGYEPMTVQFTLETPEDARLMYHLCNCNDLKSLLSDREVDRAEDFSNSLNSDLWEEIKKHLESYGYEL